MCAGARETPEVTLHTSEFPAGVEQLDSESGVESMAMAPDTPLAAGVTAGVLEKPELTTATRKCGNNSAGVRSRKRAGRKCGKPCVLSPSVSQQIFTLVGHPTLQLRIVKGLGPTLVNLSSAGNECASVRVDPQSSDHVLVCGSSARDLFTLLRHFRRLRKELPQLQGTFVVPENPVARYWKLLCGKRVMWYTADMKVCESVAPDSAKCEGHSWVVYSTVESHAGEESSTPCESVESECGISQSESAEVSELCAVLPDLSKVLITFSVSIRGQTVKCLIDSGASDDFLDRHLATSLDLPTVRASEKRRVKMANGSIQDASCLL